MQNVTDLQEDSPVFNLDTILKLAMNMDKYDIFYAIRDQMKGWCSWRTIPHGFSKWQNVRYHYDILAVSNENEGSVLDRILRKLMEAQRGA